MTPDILYEDSHIIVCVKPAGTPTQSSRVQTPDMVSILKNHIYKNSAQKQPPYLAVIHRLDQPVEGLLVFAKTPVAAADLNRQLTRHGFGKYYRTLLNGIPTSKEGVLTDYLLKDGQTNTSRICTSDTPGAKKAILHYQVLRTLGSCCIAEVTLETGRHHQIRVQMAHMGCPIAGDQKYGKPFTSVSSDSSTLEPFFHSLQLYACRLTFHHPKTKKQMEFTLDRLEHIK